MIAYDTNILIYALEGSNSWSKAAQAIVQKGEHEGAVLSVLAWQEMVTGLVLKDGDLEKELLAVFGDLGATRFVPVTLAICDRATLLTKQYGKKLYGYDAIHIATAIEYKATSFITNDKTLIGLQIKEIPILSL